MKFEDAIRKAIKSYRDGKDPEEYIKARGKPMEYDRTYLDELEEEVMSSLDPKSKKKKVTEEE